MVQSPLSGQQRGSPAAGGAAHLSVGRASRPTEPPILEPPLEDPRSPAGFDWAQLGLDTFSVPAGPPAPLDATLYAVSASAPLMPEPKRSGSFGNGLHNRCYCWMEEGARPGSAHEHPLRTPHRDSDRGLREALDGEGGGVPALRARSSRLAGQQLGG